MARRSNPNRLAHIVAVLCKHALAHALGARARRWPRLRRRLPEAHLAGPERLRAVIEDIGGTFIKFGQMLALQPDILPLGYCNALFNLLDRVAPFAFEEVERIFIEECGRAPHEVFDTFETAPIATASIGQVHVAYLAGRKYAVKVQRPNVETDFAGDIRLMNAMIRLIKRLRLKPLYWLLEPTSEFIAWTDEELDYRREARYLEQQRRHARDNPHERIPEVLWDYTTRRTLVAEFLAGVSVLDYLRALNGGDQLLLRRLTAVGFEPHCFVTNLLENFLGDAYRYGMFHADLHPANLLILPGNVVGYIDFGITGVLSRYSRESLVALTLNLGRGDLDAMCASFFKISAMNAESNVAGFRAGLQELAAGWYEQQGAERRLIKNATLVMLEMLQLSRRTGIYPERDVVKYIRSAIAIDGLITRAAPGFDLGRQLELICARHLKWEAWRARFAYDALLALSGASTHLLRDGALRAGSLLGQLSAGELPVRVETDQAPPQADRAERQRAIQLAAVVLAVTLLMTVAGEQVRWGVNLFTAEVLLLTTATLLLGQTIRRLV